MRRGEKVAVFVHIFQNNCIHLLLLYRVMFVLIPLCLPLLFFSLFSGPLRDHVARVYQGLGLGNSALEGEGT